MWQQGRCQYPNLKENTVGSMILADPNISIEAKQFLMIMIIDI